MQLDVLIPERPTVAKVALHIFLARVIGARNRQRQTTHVELQIVEADRELADLQIAVDQHVDQIAALLPVRVVGDQRQIILTVRELARIKARECAVDVLRAARKFAPLALPRRRTQQLPQRNVRIANHTAYGRRRGQRVPVVRGRDLHGWRRGIAGNVHAKRVRTRERSLVVTRSCHDRVTARAVRDDFRLPVCIQRYDRAIDRERFGDCAGAASGRSSDSYRVSVIDELRRDREREIERHHLANGQGEALIDVRLAIRYAQRDRVAAGDRTGPGDQAIQRHGHASRAIHQVERKRIAIWIDCGRKVLVRLCHRAACRRCAREVRRIV